MNPELEAQLSALIDGELDEIEAARLREAIAASPELRERFEALRDVDGRLRELAGRPVPSDLHARLRARIDAAPASPRVAPGPANHATPRRAGRRLAVAATVAAIAAALALLVLLPDSEEAPEQIAREPEPPVPEQIAREPEPPVPEQIAREPEPPVPEQIAREPGPGPAEDPVEIDDAEVLAAATVIAGEDERVDEDLAVIEVLELLEALDSLEGLPRG